MKTKILSVFIVFLVIFLWSIITPMKESMPQMSKVKKTTFKVGFLGSARPETAVSIWQLPGRALCRISGKAY